MFLEKTRQVSDECKKLVVKTPLKKSLALCQQYDTNVYLKCENLQSIGAFKIRGSYAKIISELKSNTDVKYLFAASSGNHAAGVCLSAMEHNLVANIYMPMSTPKTKVDNVKKFGGNPILVGSCYDEAYVAAKKACDLQSNSLFIHPFDDEFVILGNATISMEIIDDLSDVDTIIVPIGGGGLISGIAKYAKLVSKDIRVIGVEPINNPSMRDSFISKKVVKVDFKKTLADGVNVLEVAKNNLDNCLSYVDEIICVEENDIKDAMKTLSHSDKLVVEGAGCLSVAALKYLNFNKDENVACILSGGNVDMELFSQIVGGDDEK